MLPPAPIRRVVYKCDSIFHVDKVMALYQTYDQYGVIHLDGQDTELFRYGRELVRVCRYNVRLPRNHDRGGQSQARIQRLREERIHEYLKGINERAVKHYIDSETGLPCIKGLVISGPGMKPAQFMKDYMDPRLATVCLGKITCEALDVNHIQELIGTRAGGESAEKWAEFTEMIQTAPDRLVFGREETLERLQEGMLNRVYLSTNNPEIAAIVAIAREFGCTVHLVGRLCDEYGGICGITWY